MHTQIHPGSHSSAFCATGTGSRVAPVSCNVFIPLLAGLLIAAWTAGNAATVQAQPRRIAEEDVDAIATFGEARALAADPAGLLYVADAQASTVVVLTPTGQIRQTVGGPGTQAGRFDGPADVDPTNGLSLWVADAGNGRLQHFSENLRFLESLPVGRIGPADGPQSRQPVFDVGRDGSDVRAEGEPVAVFSTTANELFAIDARQSTVLKWDAQRRPERVIGGFDARRGRLQQPVAIAMAKERLFVADRALDALLVYDRFGTYIETLRPVSLQAVQSLAVERDRLWVATATHVHALTPGGSVKKTYEVDLDAPVVDVVVQPSVMYLLTSATLFRYQKGQ